MRLKFLVAVLGAVLVFFGATAVARAATAGVPGGAPLCDDRGASAYAAEPTPQPVDSGTLSVSHDACASEAALAAATPASGHDDLQRVPPSARNVAAVAHPIELGISVFSERLVFESTGVDGARDGFAPTDNPPPRPVPWRG